MKNKKDENKQDEFFVMNDVVDYDIAREIINLLINKHMPITAKRAQKILDMAKSMSLDIAHIMFKD